MPAKSRPGRIPAESVSCFKTLDRSSSHRIRSIRVLETVQGGCLAESSREPYLAGLRPGPKGLLCGMKHMRWIILLFFLWITNKLTLLTASPLGVGYFGGNCKDRYVKSTESGPKSTWTINRGRPEDPRTRLDYSSITIIRHRIEKHLRRVQKTHFQRSGWWKVTSSLRVERGEKKEEETSWKS